MPDVLNGLFSEILNGNVTLDKFSTHRITITFRHQIHVHTIHFTTQRAISDLFSFFYTPCIYTLCIMPVSLVNLETSFSQTTPIWSILCNITGLSLECTTKSPKRVNFINYMIRNELVLPQFDRPTDRPTSF